jgi:hypothetical protein
VERRGGRQGGWVVKACSARGVLVRDGQISDGRGREVRAQLVRDR